jgi:hypothetical protein
LAEEGKLVATLDDKSGIRVLNGETGREHRRFSDAIAFALSSDGQFLAALHKDKTLRLWETATGRLLHEIGIGQETYPHSFSGDAKILATCTPDRTIQFWETATGKEVCRLQYPSNKGMGQMTLSADGKLAAAVIEDIDGPDASNASIYVWDVTTGKEFRRFEIAYWSALSLRFSSDGRILAAGDTGGVHLWELASGQVRRRFKGHRSLILALAFSPDDRLLASGGDRTSLVWDLTGISPDGRLPALELRAEEIDRLWNELAGRDKVDRAIWSLIAAPRQSVPFLATHLEPTLAVAEQRVTKLITELDDQRFQRREEVTAELEQIGELAERLLRKTLASKPSLEVRRRLETLLARLDGPITSSEKLRKQRAIEVLEHIGTLEAQEVLKTLSRGAAEARLTQEAKASLERLAKQASP